MKYLLSIFVPPEFFYDTAAERFLDALRNLVPYPDYLLVVDHAIHALGSDAKKASSLENDTGYLVLDEATRAKFQTLPHTKHGHMVPTFPPLVELHDLADEVRCCHDRYLDNGTKWKASRMFKKYSVLRAIDLGMDAVMFLRFPDRCVAHTPEALLAALNDSSFAYPAVLKGDENGDVSAPATQQRKPPIADEFTPRNKITEDGYMLRLAGLDRSAIEAIQHGEEPQLLLAELLESGVGRGIGRHHDDPIYLTKAKHSRLRVNLKRKQPRLFNKLQAIECRRSDNLRVQGR